jgi:LPS-assembly lipoprotein
MWWQTDMSPRASLKTTCQMLIPALVAAVLSGCGFQLRGAPPVSAALQPLAIHCASQIPADLCQSVQEQLELGGVDLQESGKAKFTLRLSDFRQDRRATAITAQAAAAEYTLRYSVALELISRDQIPMIADTRLTTSESYRYDESNVLAKQREEETLRTQLNSRLAQQIIFRLAPMTETRIQAIRKAHEEARNSTDKQPDSP